MKKKLSRWIFSAERIGLIGNDGIFDVSVVDYIDIIRYTEGDKVTLEYQEGEPANVVLGIK